MTTPPHNTDHTKRKQLQAEAILILVAFFWGTTFVIVDWLIEGADNAVAVHWLHTLRFGTGAALLWGIVFAMPSTRSQSHRPFQWKPIFRAGACLGIPLFLSYALQAFGLLTTTPSKSAFITGTAVLWVPLLLFVLFRRVVEAKSLGAGAIGLAGLFLLVMESGWRTLFEQGPIIGDALTMGCAVMVAVHIILTKHYSHRFPTTLLTAIQLTVVAVFSLACSFIWREEQTLAFPFTHYLAIAFLILFPTVFNFWAVTRMQRYTTEERAAIIFLFDPLFAAATAWLVLGELLALPQWLGAALILTAILMLETNLFTKNGKDRHTVIP